MIKEVPMNEKCRRNKSSLSVAPVLHRNYRNHKKGSSLSVVLGLQRKYLYKKVLVVDLLDFYTAVRGTKLYLNLDFLVYLW